MSWRALVVAPLAVLLVLFALSNQQPVRLTLWPFDLEWDASLALAVLVVAALAFLLGAGIAWGASLPHRVRERRLRAEVTALRAQLPPPPPAIRA